MSTASAATGKPPIMSLVPTIAHTAAMIDVGPLPTKPDVIRNEIKSLAHDVTSKFLRLAHLLRIVSEQKLYETWGYDSFERYIDEEAKVNIETARTFINIEREVIEKAKIPREAVEEMGWTKAKVLIPAARDGQITEANKAHVIEQATVLPTTKLRTFVDTTFRKEGAAPALTSTTFFFTAEQLETVTHARELAGELNNSLDPGVQLTAICSEYLSSITEHDTKAPDLFRLRRLHTLVEVLDQAYGLRVILEGKTPDGTALLKKFQKTDSERPVI